MSFNDLLDHMKYCSLLLHDNFPLFSFLFLAMNHSPLLAFVVFRVKWSGVSMCRSHPNVCRRPYSKRLSSLTTLNRPLDVWLQQIRRFAVSQSGRKGNFQTDIKGQNSCSPDPPSTSQAALTHSFQAMETEASTVTTSSQTKESSSAYPNLDEPSSSEDESSDESIGPPSSRRPPPIMIHEKEVWNKLHKAIELWKFWYKCQNFGSSLRL